MSSLTPEDQITVLNSHKKNLNFNEYNLQVALIEENAKATPAESALSSINAQLADIAKQQAALDAEIAKITPATPTA